MLVRLPVLLLLALGWLAAAPAEARVTSVTITSVQSPAFAGASFGSVGQYEKIIGSYTAEIDPTDPKNALIADIGLAPLTARGTVAYSATFYLLRPINQAAGRHALLYEANNRGNKFLLSTLDAFSTADNTIAHPNDPNTAKDAGDGWLMQQGYTLAWSGWDALLLPSATDLTLTAPVAQGPGGAAVTGPALEEFNVSVAGVTNRNVTYNAADTSDLTTPTLTMRLHYADPPIPITGFSYPFAGRVAWPPGQTIKPGWLYEFTYTATNPYISGIGFAAVRDVVALLRRGEGTVASPLGSDIAKVFGIGWSEGGRYLRDYVRLGFNASEDGDAVFDGVLMDTAGANGIDLNRRFAQPSETERQHTFRWFPEGRFPFAWNTTTDPVSGGSDGALARCTASATCPKIFETVSANDYWEKAASLLTTDPTGTTDLPDAPGVRVYLFASTPHAAGSGLGVCAQPQNPLENRPAQRAMLAALDAWVRLGTAPPPSAVPRLADHTLAMPAAVAAVHFPPIPGVVYNGVATIRNARTWGPAFGPTGGVATILPPLMIGTQSPTATTGPGIYPSYVPTTDADGNDIAGIRLPDVAVPVATYTGWGLGGPGQDVGDGCAGSGQMLALPPTAAAAARARDPRKPLAERYPTHAAYVAAIAAAATALQARGLLLPQDAAAYTARAQLSSVGTGSAVPPQPIGE